MAADSEAYGGEKQSPIFVRTPSFKRPRVGYPKTVFWLVARCYLLLLACVAVAVILGVPQIAFIPGALLTLLIYGVLIWVFGSFAMRAAGIVIGIDALWSSYVDPNTKPVNETIQLIFGALLWLAGHWLFALRHQRWNSWIARGIAHRLPSRLNPVFEERWQSVNENFSENIADNPETTPDTDEFDIQPDTDPEGEVIDAEVIEVKEIGEVDTEPVVPKPDDNSQATGKTKTEVLDNAALEAAQLERYQGRLWR